MPATRIYLRHRGTPVLVEEDAAAVADTITHERERGRGLVQFTGASRHFGNGAVFVNPVDVQGVREHIEVEEPDEGLEPEVGDGSSIEADPMAYQRREGIEASDVEGVRAEGLGDLS